VVIIAQRRIHKDLSTRINRAERAESERKEESAEKHTEMRRRTEVEKERQQQRNKTNQKKEPKQKDRKFTNQLNQASTPRNIVHSEVVIHTFFQKDTNSLYHLVLFKIFALCGRREGRGEEGRGSQKA
jgi:hypothetical protein